MSGVQELHIQCEVVIDAPVAVVWRTITEPDQIVRWFAERAELVIEPGMAGALIFENEQRTLTAAVEVVDVEAPTRFSFRWSHPEGEAPVPSNSTLVEFTLAAEGDERTRLRVTETGLDAVAWPDGEKQRFADDHNGGWSRHLTRLHDLFPSRGSA
jgi:uncharacterized protein YndB with AHSA1/START domain